MDSSIIVALVTGGFTFAGVLITNLSSNRKVVNNIKTEFRTSQAVTECKIEDLTREVREHNNFAKRMPVVEAEIKHIHEKINSLHK